MDTENAGLPPELDERLLRRLDVKAHYYLVKFGALGFEDPKHVAFDAFVDLYRKWAEGGIDLATVDGRLLGLADAIVRNKAADAARRGIRRRERPAPHSDVELAGTAAALDRFRALATTTWTRLERLDAKDGARRILDFLAAREREPGNEGDYDLFVLRHVDGLEYAEVAARRGRGESGEAVRSRLRRLEALLRERFPPPDDEGGEPEAT